MFTYLNRPPNQECVYNLIEQTVDHRARGPPMFVISSFKTSFLIFSYFCIKIVKDFAGFSYRSQFSCMVRQEADCRKVGCYKTMGVPKVCLCPPENYLKKNSRAPISIKPPAVPRVKICSECPPPCSPPPQPCDPCAAEGDADKPCEETDTTAGIAGSSCDADATTCPPPEPCFVAKKRPSRLCCNVMKPPIPSPCVGFELIPRGCKNYIHHNIVKALRLPARKPALRFVDHPKGHVQAWCESGYPRKYVYKETFGCVPNYIQDIKEELYRNDMQAKCDMKLKERDIQAQIRHLEPTEHQALICGLKKNWEETFNEFQKLPLLIDTAGKREKKKQLEDELKRLEQDIQTMERHDHIFVTDTCRSFYLA